MLQVIDYSLSLQPYNPYNINTRVYARAYVCAQEPRRRGTERTTLGKVVVSRKGRKD